MQWELHSHTVNSHKVTYVNDRPRGRAHVHCLFLFFGRLTFYYNEGCLRWHQNKLEMPNAKVTEAKCLLLVSPNCCTIECYQTLMCFTFQAMRLFLCFYLRDHLLHIHDTLAHAPQAMLLFRWVAKQCKADTPSAVCLPSLWLRCFVLSEV